MTQAAQRVHITQSTASDQLREITQNVGLPLYEVVSRQLHLTELGVELAQTARRILDSLDEFEQQRDGRLGLTQGRLRVAAVSTAKYFIPRLLGQFCQRYPGIEVSLEILNRQGVVSRLRNNLDDLYVMSMPPEDLPLVDTIFMENPLVVIAPGHHRLARQSEIQPQELASERFILRESDSGTRMAVDQHFQSLGIQPLVRMELGSNEAIREAVSGGLGLGIVSRHALAPDVRVSGVQILSVDTFPIPSRWHLVYRAKRVLSPVAEAFRTHLNASSASSVDHRIA